MNIPEIVPKICAVLCTALVLTGCAAMRNTETAIDWSAQSCEDLVVLRDAAADDVRRLALLDGARNVGTAALAGALIAGASIPPLGGALAGLALATINTDASADREIRTTANAVIEARCRELG